MTVEPVTGLVAPIHCLSLNPPGALHGQPHATTEEHHTLEGGVQGLLGRVNLVPIPRREGLRQVSTCNREGS